MRKRVRRALDTWSCLLVLAFVPLIAFWPATFFRQVPANLDSLFFSPPWQDARPDTAQPSTLTETDADALRYGPWYVYMNHAVRNGGGVRDLLWNPLEGCGTPFFAIWRTRCLSPFSAPFYVLPPGNALQWSTWLKLLVAGWSAYYAARKFGFRRPLALVSGVSYQLSGHVFLWHMAPMSDVAVWLPLLIVSSERLVVGQSRYWPLGALVVAVMALGGDPETLTACLLFVLAFVVLRLVLTRGITQGLPAFWAAIGAMVILGLALAAVQIVPYIEFLGQAASTGRDASSTTLRLKDLIVCFLPAFFGNTPGVVTAEGVVRDTHVLRLLHCGLIQFLLLALWFAVRSFAASAQRRRIEAGLLAAALMMVCAMLRGRISIAVPYLHLPGPEHFLVGNALALALMSAAAADEWLVLNVREVKGALVRLAVFVPLLVILFVVCLYAYREIPRPGSPALWVQVLVMAVLGVFLLALTAVTLLRPSPYLMGYGLALLTLVAAVAMSSRAVRYVDGEKFFPDTPFVASLKEGGERVGGSDAMSGWPLAGNLVPQVYAPAGIMTERQAAFLGRVKESPFLLRRAGVRSLVLTRDDVKGTFASIRSTLNIERVFPSGAVLFKDLGARARAWITYEARSVQQFDPAQLDADQPPLVEGTSLPPLSGGPGEGGSGEAENRAAVKDGDSSVNVVIEAETTRPGLLVLSDTFYPGWKAMVEGQEAEMFPVEGVFRGVQVKEGRRRVEFRFEPWSIRLGVYISLAAGVILLLEMRHLVLRRNSTRR